MNSVDLSTVQKLLEKLYRAYQRRDMQAAGGDFGVSMPLALALLRRLQQESEVDCVRHVVVLGPTQAGKSTVVNLLLQAEHAQVSALAGYTRALAGFAVALSRAQLTAVRGYLQHSARPDAHQLTEIEETAMARVGGLVVWDTPDFDSVSSREYRVDIADAVALADLVVLVVSREKYADLSVWRMLDLLQPLQPPLILCLNKSGDDIAALRQSLRRRLNESRFQAADVTIQMLPYAPRPDAAFDKAAANLRRLATERLSGQPRSARMAGLQRLLAEHWHQWLAPVRAEIAQADAWDEAVSHANGTILAAYRARYLDDARYYTTFNQAVVRLLELLEIPGLAGPLAKTRQLLTWPLRKLFGVGEPEQATAPRLGMEFAVLSEALEHALLNLRQRLNELALDNDQGATWAAVMNRALATEHAPTRERFAAAVELYQRDFETEIAAAAQSLYAELERRPTVLNGLRAARLGADAAGVLLAVKTGAVGVNEAVLTPAMLSLTSMLTESAVGKYVDTVREDLKRRQYTRVSELVSESFTRGLQGLARRLDSDRLFAIDADEIERVERARSALRP